MIVNNADEAQNLRNFCKKYKIKCFETEDQVHFNAGIYDNRCSDYSVCPKCEKEIWSFRDESWSDHFNKIDLKQVTIVIQPRMWNKIDEAMIIFECPYCFERIYFHQGFLYTEMTLADALGLK